MILIKEESNMRNKGKKSMKDMTSFSGDCALFDCAVLTYVAVLGARLEKRS